MGLVSFAHAWNPLRYLREGHHTGGCPPGPTQSSTYWNGWAGTVSNRRWVQDTVLNTDNAKSLSPLCQVKYPNGVSAAPAISGDIAYFPTWGGLLVALNYKTCQEVWTTNITQVVVDYAPIDPDFYSLGSPVSRTSPFLQDGILYLGTQLNALLLAVDASSGAVIARKNINPHPLAVITQSPTVYDGLVLVGSASLEENAAASIKGYKCCSFAGNFNAFTLDASSGMFSTAWSLSMLPVPQGNWSGNAIWGSQPSIDPIRSQVFIATGNIYNAPKKFLACAQSANKHSSCLSPDGYEETVMALDIKTGKINWDHQISPLDAWTVACIPGAGLSSNNANCPPAPGPDADFGMSPAYVPASSASTPGGQDVVVLGQKNGNLYAMSAVDGSIIWATPTSPDGVSGGLSWGVAVDSSRVFFTAINYNQLPWTLSPSGKKIRNSAWGAANLADGKVLWDTQVLPNTPQAFNPPTIANDVVLTGRTQLTAADSSQYSGGRLVLLNADSGELVKSLDLDADFHGGIVVQDNYVLFGSGYENTFYNSTGSFYVLELSGMC